MEKKKSLRQLARELGVSASYLSQVKNGKRPPSEKVLSSVKQNPNTDNEWGSGGRRFKSSHPDQFL